MSLKTNSRSILIGTVLMLASNFGFAANDAATSKPQAFLDRGMVTISASANGDGAILRLDLISGTAELMATTPLMLKFGTMPASKAVAVRLAGMPLRILPLMANTEAAICAAEGAALINAIESITQSCAVPQSATCATAQLNFQNTLNDFAVCLMRHFTQEN
jgi:hypothetical protein